LFLDNKCKYVVEHYFVFGNNSYMLQHFGSFAFVGRNLNISDGMSARIAN